MKRFYEGIRPIDRARQEDYQRRLDNLTKPRGSLGLLEAVARRYGAIRHPDLGAIDQKCLFTFAADHGVSRAGVSLYPREVTAQMVYNFLRGGAAINVLCRHYGIKNIIVDVGVDYEFARFDGLVDRKIGRGTRNFLDGPAMTRDEAERAIEVGFELASVEIAKGAGLLGTGEMGIGNTTASSAVFAAVTALPPDVVTGQGTGIDDQRRQHKIDVIHRALAMHRPDPADPLDVLVKVGGFEIGAIMGVALAGASRGVPVVIDGFISTAGAILAIQLCPRVQEYLFFSHSSWETGHDRVLAWLGVRPLLNLDLRLGEGTGAAIAMDVITAAVKLMTEMATFDEAQVSRESDAPALAPRESVADDPV
jgi:nicotinate-nucleotide--dimethylbenzimidazole phosphoribosyltransferase